MLAVTLGEAPDLLRLQYGLFSTVSEVARERGIDPLTHPAKSAVNNLDFSSNVRSYASGLSDEDLLALQVKLGRAYLAALDLRLVRAFASVGTAEDVSTIKSHLRESQRDIAAPVRRPRVALVSMPWVTPSMPSIQLATLAAALDGCGIACDRYEFFVDYASTIGVELFKIIGNTLPFTAEWLFSRHFFGAETSEYLAKFWDSNPNSGMFAGEIESQILDVLGPVTQDFLADSAQAIDWTRYTVVGFSVSISQTAASLALSRLIKKLSPATTIVFGGSSCAGVMGQAMLRISPYIDAVVHVEGEDVLPEIVRRLDSGTSLAGLAGATIRSKSPGVTPLNRVDLYRGRDRRPPLDYSPYFARLVRTDLARRVQVWLPFEGSRGCWWGEKVQCTFCGLHEIMKFRDWKSEDVLHELDSLYERHGLTRFFAVDLILPKQFHNNLLIDLAKRTDKWTIFYEVKADMSKADVERMADAGIRWVQPGIESLDRDLLKLIKKGTNPAQNIQFLRWCKELGIRASWNMLAGIPGSRPEMYDRMMAELPLFFHLIAPRGCGDVQLHRFSPYFDKPETFGIRYKGPHHLYRSVFPIPEDDLRDLVYLHEWEHEDEFVLAERTARLRTVVDSWKAANDRDANLDLVNSDGGAATIVDTRASAQPTVTELTNREAVLYRYLDTARSRRTLAEDFALAEGNHSATAASSAWVDDMMSRWLERGLAYADGSRVVALAVDREKRMQNDYLAGEIPYL